MSLTISRSARACSTASGVPEQSANGYDLKTSVHRYLTFSRSKTGSVSDERTRLLKAQADMAELKVRLRTGEVVLRSVVATQTFAIVRRARDRMQNIPDRISGVLAAETDQGRVFTLLTTEIKQACEDLAS